MSQDPSPHPLTRADLEAELGTALPDKEVMSLLNVDIDLDLALALAAPIDLAIAGNLNVAAPIDAAVSANVLSLFSNATAVANQGVIIDQYISGEAIAEAPQDASITQAQDGGASGAEATGDGTEATGDEPVLGVTDGGDGTSDLVAPVDGAVDDATDVIDDVAVDGLLAGNLVDINVDLDLDADLAAPVAGAVALNGNVAAPIDAAAAANVGSVGSEAVAIADQQAIISQQLDDVTAQATAEQNADIVQD